MIAYGDGVVTSYYPQSQPDEAQVEQVMASFEAARRKHFPGWAGPPAWVAMSDVLPNGVPVYHWGWCVEVPDP